jgi:hypothetical protein
VIDDCLPDDTREKVCYKVQYMNWPDYQGWHDITSNMPKRLGTYGNDRTSACRSYRPYRTFMYLQNDNYHTILETGTVSKAVPGELYPNNVDVALGSEAAEWTSSDTGHIRYHYYRHVSCGSFTDAPTLPPTSSPTSAPTQFGCSDTCWNSGFSSDGVCDDGGPGYEYSNCPCGTDCTDCGPRPAEWYSPLSARCPNQRMGGGAGTDPDETPGVRD